MLYKNKGWPAAKEERRMDYIEEFTEFAQKAVSPYQTAAVIAHALEGGGFTELNTTTAWKLRRGGKFYVKSHDSSLIAFTVGSRIQAGDGFRLIATHTDFPCFRLKAAPDLREEEYGKLNVESYGGAILSSWMDRPLGLAGRVALRFGSISHPQMRLYDSERPILMIPNLPIHLNKEVNKGVELNRQTDMLPIYGMWREGGFLSWLEDQLSIEKGSILDYDFYVYCRDSAERIGLDGELFSAPRLDNMTSVFAALQGILHSERTTGINAAVFFDHEEIGSRTKQGAGSAWLSNTLERIYGELSFPRIKFLEALEESMMLSLDVSHAYHPNQGSRYDPVNHVTLNSGVTIKESGTQSYATDARGIAIVMRLMEEKGIPYRKFVNRSDQPGGSTLGSVASSFLPILTVDAGIPVLAMHSARETMGSSDLKALTGLSRAFFKMS